MHNISEHKFGASVNGAWEATAHQRAHVQPCNLEEEGKGQEKEPDRNPTSSPLSAEWEPTGWATSKAFHMQCILGEIPFQRAEH